MNHASSLALLLLLLHSALQQATCLCADLCFEGGCAGGGCCGWNDCCSCDACGAGACPPTAVPTTNNMLAPSDDATVRAFLERLRPGNGSTLTIAVVGSSGNLLGRRYGREIDACDVVVRVNDAGTAGHEQDVGHGPPLRTSGLVRVGWSGGYNTALDRGTLSPSELFIVTCPERNCDGTRVRSPSAAVNHVWADGVHDNILGRVGVAP